MARTPLQHKIMAEVAIADSLLGNSLSFLKGMESVPLQEARECLARVAKLCGYHSAHAFADGPQERS